MSDTLVFVELPDGRDIHAGWIHYEVNAGQYKPSINFEYSAGFLADPNNYPLSPDLPLHAGFIAAPMTRPVFMAFADTQPDAWGRKLIQADSRRIAKEEGHRWSPPSQLDLLLHVPDRTRQGAIRFREGTDGPFLAVPRAALPTFVDLEQLVLAVKQFERGRYDEHDDGIRMLVLAGTTQGGARPKATVLSPSGKLSIAKLPHPGDGPDVLAWEAVALELAVKSGVRAPTFELRRLDEERSILITERFDRTVAGNRVGYLSAKSLMLADDNVPVDYTMLAAHLGESSSHPTDDMGELFRRVALTLLVNNVDDHMKNHGVIRDQSGWRLSPIFDVNPFPFNASADSTPVTPDDDPSNRDIRSLVDASDQFRLSPDRAVQIVREVAAATDNWAAAAKGYDIDNDSIDLFANAFNNENRERATVLREPIPEVTVDLADTEPRRRPHVVGQQFVRAHIRNGRHVPGYWRHR